jgi:hypothetical protein
MAVIVRTRVRVEDAAGMPVNGGKFRVYLANTTTLASLFSDAALTVPLTNPVVAGSDGWCPEIFAASANYDCATLTAADVVIKSEDDVPSLGSDAATFTKDFTNSRVAIRGVGGTTYWETGDASPDNVGGTGVLGGWNGTQADSWSINAILVNILGRLKEAGKKIIGTVYTDATAFSSSAGVVIQLPNDPTGVRAWQVYIWDLQAAAASPLTAQFSYDGGLNYKSGASDYNYTKFKVDNASGPGLAAGVAAAGADTKIDIVHVLRTAANRSAMVKLLIITPDSGSEHTILYSWCVNLDAASATYMAVSEVGGEGVGGYGRATHMKILQGANLISGNYRVVPLRGFGET